MIYNNIEILCDYDCRKKLGLFVQGGQNSTQRRD